MLLGSLQKLFQGFYYFKYACFIHQGRTSTVKWARQILFSLSLGSLLFQLELAYPVLDELEINLLSLFQHTHLPGPTIVGAVHLITSNVLPAK